MTTGFYVIGQSPNVSSWQLSRSLLGYGSDLTQSAYLLGLFVLILDGIVMERQLVGASEDATLI